MKDTIELVRMLIWPLVVVSLALIFKKPLGDAVTRLLRIKAMGKDRAVEIVLDKLEGQAKLPSGLRTNLLSGLSAHDIWALNDFANEKITTYVGKMNTAQRVAARTLIDFGLLGTEEEGTGKKVVVTSLGRQILNAANSVL